MVYIWRFFSFFLNPVTISGVVGCCLGQQLRGLAWPRRDCWVLREVKQSSGCVGGQVGVPGSTPALRVLQNESTARGK